MAKAFGSFEDEPIERGFDVVFEPGESLRHAIDELCRLLDVSRPQLFHFLSIRDVDCRLRLEGGCGEDYVRQRIRLYDHLSLSLDLSRELLATMSLTLPSNWLNRRGMESEPCGQCQIEQEGRGSRRHYRAIWNAKLGRICPRHNWLLGVVGGDAGISVDISRGWKIAIALLQFFVSQVEDVPVEQVESIHPTLRHLLQGSYAPLRASLQRQRSIWSRDPPAEVTSALQALTARVSPGTPDWLGDALLLLRCSEPVAMERLMLAQAEAMTSSFSSLSERWNRLGKRARSDYSKGATTDLQVSEVLSAHFRRFGRQRLTLVEAIESILGHKRRALVQASARLERSGALTRIQAEVRAARAALANSAEPLKAMALAFDIDAELFDDFQHPLPREVATLHAHLRRKLLYQVKRSAGVRLPVATNREQRRTQRSRRPSENKE